MGLSPVDHADGFRGDRPVYVLPLEEVAVMPSVIADAGLNIERVASGHGNRNCHRMICGGCSSQALSEPSKLIFVPVDDMPSVICTPLRRQMAIAEGDATTQRLCFGAQRMPKAARHAKVHCSGAPWRVSAG